MLLFPHLVREQFVHFHKIKVGYLLEELCGRGITPWPKYNPIETITCCTVVEREQGKVLVQLAVGSGVQ